ncbi:LPXTG cell wall anchor domain-containing protein [Enterococcus termitis]|uniref:Gram-positive cocci surface proteins LPxTG domain-containing protein n=1 Tax=Enterococcus termitis TaxID=332950 RepID=A0A1E5GZI2_9ENTE|nr:LPXTG cell wall anchor domain-containing protein [Enterococcus termitis]OEG18134.1 hypothetical protein BCR25_16705 [Enterococcus termitis]OJG97167.1 hypothetical protein RV18_GL001032 [Enterococcus termitis]
MKKRHVFVALLSLCGFFFLTVGGYQVQAVEHKEYESRTGVGFYGSYEYPDEEGSQNDDSSSEEPTEMPSPDKPIDKEQIQNEIETNQLVSKPTGRTLPHTGEISNRFIGLIGVLIVVAIILIVLINRKKSKEENA